MSVRWYTAVVFCRDATVLSRWWAEALGGQIVPEEDGRVFVFPPHQAGAPGQVPADGGGPGLEFVEADEHQRLGNRLYITVAPPAGGDHEAEIRRLEAMGATLITIGGAGVDYSIMEDPEGNGFSVYTSRAPRPATGS